MSTSRSNLEKPPAGRNGHHPAGGKSRTVVAARVLRQGRREEEVDECRSGRSKGQ